MIYLSLEGLAIKDRSPFLAGVMSAVIPGSGKMYAGRFWDGLQAFSMVVAPAYNAYYHFKTKGMKTFEGWLWTSVASWFYLSDIYGSVKATLEYNDMQRFKIIEKLEK
jgi:TM2 domain-containing membrane protein YozV